jgi:hypothetical protein
MAARDLDYYYKNFTNGKDAASTYVTDGGTPGDSIHRELSNASRSRFTLNKNSSTNSSRTPTQGSIANPFDVIKTGSANSKISSMSDQYKSSIEASDLKNPASLTLKLNNEILKQLERESDLHTQISEGMGLTGDLSAAFRETLIETMPAAAKLDYDISHITDMMTTLTEKTGKFSIISTTTLEKSFETARAFGMTLPQLSDAFVEFEKVGLGAADALKNINDAGIKSAGLGLNSKKTTQDLKDNLGKLNEYGFKNGVEGLNRMVQKAAEFRMNMAETFKVADKVMNPESAIELTANMQMLGGAVGDLNDPLKLMYMATNNVEGLQDAIMGAAGTLATYNTEQQKFEITGANLRRGKEMAAQLGISYSEFAKGAIAAQERLMATDTLLARGFNLKDKDREFITNLSQMKDGEMQIVIPKSLSESLGKEIGTNEIKLSDLTQTQIDLLQMYQKDLEGKTEADMAKDMFTETKQITLNTAATAQSITTFFKRQAFGREGRLSESKIPLLAPGVEAIGDTMKNLSSLTKTPEILAEAVGVPLKSLGKITGEINKEFEVIKNEFINLKNKLLEMSKTQTTQEQSKTAEENKRKLEQSNNRNNDGAFMGNLNIKLTKTGFGNDMTIDQTEKGYLTPMRNTA